MQTHGCQCGYEALRSPFAWSVRTVWLEDCAHNLGLGITWANSIDFGRNIVGNPVAWSEAPKHTNINKYKQLFNVCPFSGWQASFSFSLILAFVLRFSTYKSYNILLRLSAASPGWPCFTIPRAWVTLSNVRRLSRRIIRRNPLIVVFRGFLRFRKRWQIIIASRGWIQKWTTAPGKPTSVKITIAYTACLWIDKVTVSYLNVINYVFLEYFNYSNFI